MWLPSSRQDELERFRTLLENRHGDTPYIVFEGRPTAGGKWHLEEFGHPVGFDLTPAAMVDTSLQLGRKALMLVIPDADLEQAQLTFGGVRGEHLHPADLVIDLPHLEVPPPVYDDAMHQRVLARARELRPELQRRLAQRAAQEQDELHNPFGP